MRHAKTAIAYLLAVVVGLIFLGPFLWVLITAFKPNTEIYSNPILILPSHLILDHFAYVFQKSDVLLGYFQNSVIVTVLSVAGLLLTASTLGYALGRYDLPGEKIWIGLVMLLMAVPWGTYLVPVFIMEDLLNITNTKLGLILPYVALNLPLSTLIMRGTFRTIPQEIKDAAEIDGCGPWQTWHRIMLPMARAGLATVLIFGFIRVWEEFMFAQTLVTNPKLQTVPVGIVNLQNEAQSWAFGVLSAAIVLAIVPALIVFLALHKHFMRGLVDGAIKG